MRSTYVSLICSQIKLKFNTLLKEFKTFIHLLCVKIQNFWKIHCRYVQHILIIVLTYDVINSSIGTLIFSKLIIYYPLSWQVLLQSLKLLSSAQATFSSSVFANASRINRDGSCTTTLVHLYHMIGVLVFVDLIYHEGNE